MIIPIPISHLVKDYVDIFNSYCDTFVRYPISLTETVQFTFYYFVKSVGFLIQYVFTFQWIFDFCALKVRIPEFMHSGFIDVLHSNPPNALFKFSTFDTLSFSDEPFISGLVNSLFISLPVTSSHIIWIRQVVIGGKEARIFASLGLIFGQTFFILLGLYGFRFFAFPFFSFEFFELISLIIGISASVIIVYKLRRRPAFLLIRSAETEKLRNLFLIQFVLTWTERNMLFQHFSNISLSPEPTLLEAINSYHSILDKSSYLSGLFLGQCFWMGLLALFITRLGFALSDRFNFTYSQWIQAVHRFVLVVFLAFSVSSVPYYNTDYLLTSPFGFIPQDDSLPGFHLRTTRPDFEPKGKLGRYSERVTLDTDTVPYNRSRYSAGEEVETTFEDWNHYAEYSWRHRIDLRPLRNLKKYKIHIPYLRKFIRLIREKTFQDYRSGKHRSRYITKLIEKWKIPPSKNHDPYTDRKYQVPKNKPAYRYQPFDPYTTFMGIFRINQRPMEDEDLDRPRIVRDFEPGYPLDALKLFIRNDPYDRERRWKRDKFAKRYVKEYEADVQYNRFPHIPFLEDEDAYSNFSDVVEYGMDPVSTLFTDELDAYQYEYGKRIKSRFYRSFIYKFFMYRQFLKLNPFSKPKEHYLKNEEQNELFRKRLVLANYYDSLRAYRNIPMIPRSYSDEFQNALLGPKSYANRVYNQNFKGTLRIVRRLFSVSLANADFSKARHVLKYDQPLFKDLESNPNPILHEELKTRYDKSKKLTDRSRHQMVSDEELRMRATKSKRWRRRHRPSYNKWRFRRLFLRRTNPMPFYVGWDDESRQLMITNYLIPQAEASRKSDFFKEIQPPTDSKTIKKSKQKLYKWFKHSKLYELSKRLKFTNFIQICSKYYKRQKQKTIYFLTWPLSESEVQKQIERKYKTKRFKLMSIYYQDPEVKQEEKDLFFRKFSEVENPEAEMTEEQYLTKFLSMDKKELVYEHASEVLEFNPLPYVIKRTDLVDFDKIIPRLHPLRGGYIWPNARPLRADILKNVDKITDKIKRFNEAIKKWQQKDTGPTIHKRKIK